MTPDLVELNAEISREFPSFSVRYKKDSLWMKFLGFLFRVLTFGLANTFMTDYTTTVGNIVYVPSKWDTFSSRAQATTLRHERVHMRQARKHGRLMFGFLYFFVYFPIGFAWWRAKLEMEAYEESMTAVEEYGGNILHPEYRDAMISHFTGPAYFWMWPFKKSISKWFDQTAARITETEPPA